MKIKDVTLIILPEKNSSFFIRSMKKSIASDNISFQFLRIVMKMTFDAINLSNIIYQTIRKTSTNKDKR